MDFRKKKTRSDRYLVIECFGLNGIVTFSYQIENSVIITGKALGTVSISALTKDHADLWRDGNEKHGDAHRY